jgi:hypothetical protein
MFKYAAFSILGIVALTLLMEGCGSSGTNSSNTATVGPASITNCTTATTGENQYCMSDLNQAFYYQGYVNITNGGLAENFIKAFPQFASDNIAPSSITEGYMTISITPSSEGPIISMTIQFPTTNDNYGVAGVVFGGTYGAQGVYFPSYNYFQPSSNKTLAANDAGEMIMEPYGVTTEMTLAVNSLTQSWDASGSTTGSYPPLVSLTVTVNGSTLGTANLDPIP